MKPMMLALLLPLVFVACKKTSTPTTPQVNKLAEFEKIIEAEAGADFYLEKDNTETPGYVVFRNQTTQEAIAYNINKFDPSTMKSYADYLLVASAGTDVVSGLKTDWVWIEEGYYQDQYRTNTGTTTYYDEDCSCNRTETWTENVWVGQTWVDSSYNYVWYTGSGMRFSATETLPKDFETLKAMGEEKALKAISTQLGSSMNLSTDRAQELAKIYYKWKKVESKRELTETEKSYLMTDALGVSYAQAEKAITQKMIGNDQAYEEMLIKAAEVNRTTPEKIGDFLSEMVLEE